MKQIQFKFAAWNNIAVVLKGRNDTIIFKFEIYNLAIISLVFQFNKL